MRNREFKLPLEHGIYGQEPWPIAMSAKFPESGRANARKEEKRSSFFIAKLNRNSRKGLIFEYLPT
jgi:hypothetical protein